MFRSPKSSTPKPDKKLSGLPLKSEDQWISKYINNED